MRRLALAASLAALMLGVSAAPAPAAVTIGQVGTPFVSGCSANFDWLQPTVTSGGSYVVPVDGTITSWSHNALPGAGQKLTMKVFRHVTGSTYSVVGHDGPRDLAPDAPNTFSGISVPVRAGDVLGMHTVTSSGCVFSATGDTYLFRAGDLADGGSGDFSPPASPNFRLNISAVVEPAASATPSNAFTIVDLDRNKRKGTATLKVNVPSPGELALAGNGVKSAGVAGAVAAKTVTAPGTVELLVKAQGRKKRALSRKGKVKVSPTITYTPTGGAPSSQSLKVKLKRKR